jgi:hypothetical protein
MFCSKPEKEFDINVRIEALRNCYDIMAEMASISCEIKEIRKSRKIDEKKMRAQMIEEYDGLVQELVNEITVVRNRFREYQLNNFNEVMLIMTEAKKAELWQLSKNQELPQAIRDKAKGLIKQENEVVNLRSENHELQMTLLKIRSMFTMKEQSLKTMFSKKVVIY